MRAALRTDEMVEVPAQHAAFARTNYHANRTATDLARTEHIVPGYNSTIINSKSEAQLRLAGLPFQRALLLMGAAVMLLVALAATSASALASTNGEPSVPGAQSVQTKCVAGTAPAGNTPAGTCSSPFDAPPNLDKKCGFELVKIAAQIWVPGAFVKVWKILRYAKKLIGGVAVPAAVWGWGDEWVEGHFRNGFEWVERWVCRNA